MQLRALAQPDAPAWPDHHRAGMLLARGGAALAHHMELLAKDAGLDRADQDQAFMPGMFSLLGCCLAHRCQSCPLPQLSGDLPEALLQHQGRHRPAIACWWSRPTNSTSPVPACRLELRLTPAQITLRSVEACHWMLGIARDVEGWRPWLTPPASACLAHHRADPVFRSRRWTWRA
ncbi:MAG: hypothetical protein IPN53_00005, partial [Comamonadaceae bacterium]|nr:hypothetical protein [Comamonadaceae bacterium]